MAHWTLRLVAVLVLAIFAGACASRSGQIQVAPVDKSALYAELDALRERREQLRKEEADLQKQKPLPTERLVQVRAGQIRLNEREAFILKQLNRKADKAEREAAEQLQKEANTAREAEEEKQRAIRAAKLEGCDPATVGISARAQANQRKLDVMNFFPTTLIVRVYNDGKTPINVTTPFRGIGSAVMNLCAGGSINVSFELRLSDPDITMITLRAETVSGTGQTLFTEQSYQLNKQNQQYRIQNPTLSVKLN
ncbi:MAG: hypothetical protein AB198_01165 [Parcubacteria bacterium C7867-003]|nr:MAG: hypothetical protein AB198_01165 [Parcubacteria bacterium C7867-003]